MLLVTQNKERVIWFGRAFNALQYNESTDRKGKSETVHHEICISDGCLEPVAEYESKERCLEVLKKFCEAYENECWTTEYFDVQAQATIPAIRKQNTVFEFPEK